MAGRKPRSGSKGGSKKPGRPKGGDQGRKKQVNSAPKPELQRGQQLSLVLGEEKPGSADSAIVATTKNGAVVELLPPPSGMRIDPDELIALGRKVKLRTVAAIADPSASGKDKYRYQAELVEPKAVEKLLDAERVKKLPVAYKTGERLESGNYTVAGLRDNQVDLMAVKGLQAGDTAIVRQNRHFFELGGQPDLVLVSDKPKSDGSGREYVFDVKSVREAREFRKDGQFRGAKLRRDPKRPGEYLSTVADNNNKRKDVRVWADGVQFSHSELKNDRFEFQIVSDSEPWEAVLMDAHGRDEAQIKKQPDQVPHDALAAYTGEHTGSPASVRIEALRALDSKSSGTVEHTALVKLGGALDETGLAMTILARVVDESGSVPAGMHRDKVVRTYFDVDVEAADGEEYAGETFHKDNFVTHNEVDPEGALYTEAMLNTQRFFMEETAMAFNRLNLLIPSVERVLPLVEQAEAEIGDALTLRMELLQSLNEVVAQIVAIGALMEGNATLSGRAVENAVDSLANASLTLESQVHLAEAIVGQRPDSLLPKKAEEMVANPERLRTVIRSMDAAGLLALPEGSVEAIDAVTATFLESTAHAFAGKEDQLLEYAHGGEAHTRLLEALRPHVKGALDAHMGFVVVGRAGETDRAINMEALPTEVDSRFYLSQSDRVMDIFTMQGGVDADGNPIDIVYFDTGVNRLQKNTDAGEYAQMLRDQAAGKPVDQDELDALREAIQLTSEPPFTHMSCTLEEFVAMVESGFLKFERDPSENEEFMYREALRGATLPELIAYVQKKPKYIGALNAINRDAFSKDQITLGGDTMLSRDLLIAISRTAVEHARSILGDALNEHPGLGIAIDMNFDTTDDSTSLCQFTLNGQPIEGATVVLSGTDKDEAGLRAVLDRLNEVLVDETEADTDPLDTGMLEARNTQALEKRIRRDLGEMEHEVITYDATIAGGVSAAENLEAYQAFVEKWQALLDDINEYLGVDPDSPIADEFKAEGGPQAVVTERLIAVRRSKARYEVQVENDRLDAAAVKWTEQHAQAVQIKGLVEHFTKTGQAFESMQSRYTALNTEIVNLDRIIKKVGKTWGVGEVQSLITQGDTSASTIAKLLNLPEGSGEGEDPNSLQPLFVLVDRHVLPWRERVMRPFTERGAGAAPSEYTGPEIAAMEEYATVMKPAVESGYITGVPAADFDAIEALIAARRTEIEKSYHEAGGLLEIHHVRGVFHAGHEAVQRVLGEPMTGGDQPFLVTEETHPTPGYLLHIGSHPAVALDRMQVGELIAAGAIEIEYTPAHGPEDTVRTQIADLNAVEFGDNTEQYVQLGERMLFIAPYPYVGLRPGTEYVLWGHDGSGFILVDSSAVDPKTGQPSGDAHVVAIGAADFGNALVSNTHGEALFRRESQNPQRFVEALDRGEPLFEDELRRIPTPELVIAGEPRLRLRFAQSIAQEGENLPADTWVDIFDDGFDDVHQVVRAYIVQPDGSRGRQVEISYSTYARAHSEGTGLVDWDADRDEREIHLAADYMREYAISEPLDKASFTRVLMSHGFYLNSSNRCTEPRGFWYRVPSEPGEAANGIHQVSHLEVRDTDVLMRYTMRTASGNMIQQEVELSFDQFNGALNRDPENAAELLEPNLVIGPDPYNDNRVYSYWNQERVAFTLGRLNLQRERTQQGETKISGLLHHGRAASCVVSISGDHALVRIQYPGDSTVHERLTMEDFLAVLADPSNALITQDARQHREVDYYSIEWAQDLSGNDYELLMMVLNSDRQIGLRDIDYMYDMRSNEYVRTSLVGPRTVRIARFDAAGNATGGVEDVTVGDFLADIVVGSFILQREVEERGIVPAAGAPGRPTPVTVRVDGPDASTIRPAAGRPAFTPLGVGDAGGDASMAATLGAPFPGEGATAPLPGLGEMDTRILPGSRPSATEPEPSRPAGMTPEMANRFALDMRINRLPNERPWSTNRLAIQGSEFSSMVRTAEAAISGDDREGKRNNLERFVAQISQEITVIDEFVVQIDSYIRQLQSSVEEHTPWLAEAISRIRATEAGLELSLSVINTSALQESLNNVASSSDVSVIVGDPLFRELGTLVNGYDRVRNLAAYVTSRSRLTQQLATETSPWARAEIINMPMNQLLRQYVGPATMEDFRRGRRFLYDGTPMSLHPYRPIDVDAGTVQVFSESTRTMYNFPDYEFAQRIIDGRIRLIPDDSETDEDEAWDGDDDDLWDDDDDSWV